MRGRKKRSEESKPTDPSSGRRWRSGASRRRKTERLPSWRASRPGSQTPIPTMALGASISSQAPHGLQQTSMIWTPETRWQTSGPWLNESNVQGGETGPEESPPSTDSGDQAPEATTAGCGSMSDMKHTPVKRPRTKHRPKGDPKVRMTVWMTPKTRALVRRFAGVYPEFSESQIVEAAINCGMDHEEVTGMLPTLHYLRDDGRLP